MKKQTVSFGKGRNLATGSYRLSMKQKIHIIYTDIESVYVCRDLQIYKDIIYIYIFLQIHRYKDT